MWIAMRSSEGLQMVHNIVEPRQTLPILANVLARGRRRHRAPDRDRSRGRRARLGAGQVGQPGLDHDVGAQAARDRQGAAGGTARPQGAGERVGRAPVWGRVVQAGGAGAGGFSRRWCRHRDGHWITLDGKLLRDMLGADDLRDLARREPLRPERGALRRSGPGDAAGGDRWASAGPGGAAARRARGRRCRASCRARRSRRSRGSSGSGEEVQVAISDNQFMLQMPNVLLMARLIEGSSRTTSRSCPSAHPHRVMLSRGGADGGAAPGVGALRGADQAGEVRALARPC